MKLKLILFLIFVFSASLFSSSIVYAGWVNGYYRKSGTYVNGYYRSNPNGLRYDNYGYESYQPLYNSSYGKYDTYKWNTPSWSTQSDYYTGLNYYRSSQSGYGSSSSLYGSGSSYGSRSSLFDY